MTNNISLKKFYNVLFKCSYFKQEDNYEKLIKSIFLCVLKKFKSNLDHRISIDIDNLLSTNLDLRSFTGPYFIYKDSKIKFKKLCKTIGHNLTLFFSTYKTTKLLEKYQFHNIYGAIGCVAEMYGRPYIVDFSFENPIFTQDILGYHRLNSHLFNITNNTKYDCLVYSCIDNLFYKINHMDDAYTIPRGFIGTNRRYKGHKPGRYCQICSIKNCSPRAMDTLIKLEI